MALMLHLLLAANVVKGDFADFISGIGDDIQRIAIEKADDGMFDDLKKLINIPDMLPFLRDPPPEMLENIDEIVTGKGFVLE